MRLKLMFFNLQDFFLKLDYPVNAQDLDALSEDEWQLLAPRDESLKPLAKVRAIARVFREELPDIAMVCEAGGLEALANFSRLFLDDLYEPLMTPPVAERGIDTGYLVRRNLGLRHQLISHADDPVDLVYPHEADPEGCDVTALMATALDLQPPGQRRLSRDMPELRLYQPDAATPVLVLLTAHLKSPFDPDGIDKGGVARRTAEVETLLRIRARILAEVGSAVPIIIGGDMNGLAQRPDTDPEFRKIYETTDLQDVLAIAGIPSHDRITHLTYYLDKGHARQLDYIFLPASLHSVMDITFTGVHRFRFPEGDGTMAFPGSMRERWEMPSDHYPVVTVIDIAPA